MSAYYDYTEDTVRAWLEEPVHLASQGQARVAELVHETPQQRHWWPTFPTRRSQAMFSAPPLIVAGVTVAIASGAMLIGVAGPLGLDPAAPPAASLESARPGPTSGPSAPPSPALTPTATPVAVASTAKQLPTRTLAEFPVGTDPTGLVRRDDGRIFYVDRADGTVWLRDSDGYLTQAIQPGDSQGPGEPAIAPARLLVRGDPYLVVIDEEGGVWTWEGRTGSDWLLKQWATDGHGNHIGDRVIDPATPAIASFIRGESDFDLLVAFPDGRQVIRYRMGPPGRTLFKPPTGELVRPYDEVTLARDLYADHDLYVLLSDTVLRFRAGLRDEGFALEAPSDDADYRLIDGTGTRKDGRLYVYDEAGNRILVFAKRDGHLIDEWASGPGQPEVADLRDMVMQAGTGGGPPRLTWMTSNGIHESVLSTNPADAPGPDVVASGSPTTAAEAPDVKSDILGLEQEMHVLTRRLDHLKGGDTTALDQAEMESLLGRVTALQQEIEQLVPDSEPNGAEPTAIEWRTPSVTLEADRLQITASGLTFEGTDEPFLSVGSDNLGADYYSRTYQAEWREYDRWMRLWFFLEADDTQWWVDEIYTYDGKKDGDWLYYGQLAPLTRTPRGESLEMDLGVTPDDADRTDRPGLIEDARLRIDGLRLTAFAPGTTTAPLEVTGCRPVPADAAVVGEVDGREARDYFAEGTLLEGIDQLSPAEAGARLTEMGICHEFAYSYDIKRAKDWTTGAVERWCTMPDVLRLHEYDQTREPTVSARTGQVWRRALSVTDEGYVRISVRDEELRERRMQPPAGWDCPTY